MSDERLRSLIRTAQAGVDGAAWLAAGHGLRRVGRLDEAGNAALQAHACGASATELLDALTPDLSELELRVAPVSVAPAAFGPDGRTLFGVEKEGPVRLELATGVVREIVEATGRNPALPDRWPPSLVAVDLAGERLAVSTVDTKGPSVHVVEVATGRHLARIPLRSYEPHGVAFVPRSPVVIHLRQSSIEALAIGDKTHPAGRVLWKLPAIDARLDVTGSFAAFQDERVVLGEPLAAELRASVDLKLTDAGFKSSRILAASRRAVVFGDDIVLLDVDGSILARRSRPDAEPLAASPSGWLVALAAREGTLLLDLRSGRQRRFKVGGWRWGQWCASWSASGRRLALASPRGGERCLAFLEAASEREPAPGITLADGPWTELRGSGSHRWWRGRVRGRTVEVEIPGRVRRREFPHHAEAQRYLDEQVRRKLRDGFHRARRSPSRTV